jgi:hypothetical protein
MKARHPDIPWAEMAGAGNIYRHDYEDVQQRLVWGTVHRRFAALLAAVELELARLGPLARTESKTASENAPSFEDPQCTVVAACFGLGGKAGLVSVPRRSPSAVCSALSSFASLGT